MTNEELVTAFVKNASLFPLCPCDGMKTGALHVTGRTLYSYGMVIAWYDINNNLVITSLKAPSKTTAKHINLVKRIANAYMASILGTI